MDKKSNLSLVKNSPEMQARRLGKCCGNQICLKGGPDSKEETRCEWWINSAPHKFCFWNYVRDKSAEDGMMKELVQTELAELFGWSNTKTHFMLKQAMQELAEALKLHNIDELLNDSEDDEVTNSFSPDLLVDEAYVPETD